MENIQRWCLGCSITTEMQLNLKPLCISNIKVLTLHDQVHYDANWLREWIIWFWWIILIGFVVLRSQSYYCRSWEIEKLSIAIARVRSRPHTSSNERAYPSNRLESYSETNPLLSCISQPETVSNSICWRFSRWSRIRRKLIHFFTFLSFFMNHSFKCRSS